MSRFKNVFGAVPQFAAGLLFAVTAFAQPTPPNIVLILADDLGWADLACYGSPLHQTPHLDRLAAEGVRFTDAYAPAPSCSPSRAAIMTGQFPARLGMTGIVEKHRGDSAPADAQFLPATTGPHLPHETVSLAEALKSRGYATALVGKWHLGQGEYGPKGHGFDVAIAPPHRGMPASYFWPEWEGNPDMPGRFEGEYLTDRLAFEASAFIEAQRENPFFLCLSFHSVHVPIQAKAEKVTKYEALLEGAAPDQKHQNAHYAAMLESLDDGVGTVLDSLARLGLDENTIVVFTSDNGGLAHPSHVGDHTPATSNAPLREGKGFLYEGGTRVPFIVKWPGVAVANAPSAVPVHGSDLFPTLCAAAGVEEGAMPPADTIDGIDLREILTVPGVDRPRPLYWHYPHFSSMGSRPSGAMRFGKWKLIEHFESGEIELFDLETDTGEKEDLSTTQPEITTRMRMQLAVWRSAVGALMPKRPNPGYVGQ